MATVKVTIGNGTLVSVTLSGSGPVLTLQPRARVIAQKNALGTGYTIVKADGSTVDVPLAVIDALYEPFAITSANASGLMAPTPTANAVTR